MSIGLFTSLAVFIVLLIGLPTLYLFVSPVLSAFYSRNPWISFPRDSLRLRTLREEVSSNGYRWLLGRLLGKSSLGTYWSFVWVLPLGLALAFSLAYLTAPLGLSQFGSISAGWQAQLTITSLSFIVLIFLLDQIYRSRYREGVIQTFLTSSRVMPVLYFSLFSSGVLSYLYFYHTPEDISPFLLDATFFVFLGTVTGIGYVYYRVARLISSDPLDDMTVQQIRRGLRLQIKEKDRKEISNSHLERAFPEIASMGSNRDSPVIGADELGLEGFIVDVNLAKLREACNCAEADLDDDQELLVDLELGRELKSGNDIVSVNSGRLDTSELSDEVLELLREAICCSSEPAWLTGDELVDRNMAQIGETTRTAINEGTPQGLEKNLELYTGLLENATKLNREVEEQYGGTPAPISSHVDHIYREFYRILEAAGRTGNSELIRTVRGEIMRLSMMFHRQDETHLFDETISLYGSYYRVLASNPDVDRDTIHTILVNLDNLLTMLTASMKRVRSVEEVDKAVSDIESMYDLFESLFRLSIEQGDAQTFNDVWNLGSGDVFITVNPQTDIHDLEWRIERSDDEEEIEELENELDIKRGQQEAIEQVSSRFVEMRFIASAWAYQSVQSDVLGERAFREMFSESIKHYSFEELAEIYLGFRTDPRLDLFRWESEDSDVFKGVQSSRPAVDTWLKEFFCAMALLTLDKDAFDIGDLDVSDNPMADIEIDRTSYPDLEDTIQGVTKDELLSTGVAESELADLDERKEVLLALHQQMEGILERRREDQIIDSDLDPEKVSEFQDDYISSFEDKFVLRQVLEELGWLNLEQYSGEDDSKVIDYKTFYPKNGFIPNPPAEFIHRLDQQVSNIIDYLTNGWFLEEQEQLEEVTVNEYEALPEEVSEVCSGFEGQDKPVRGIVVGDFRAGRVLRDSNYFVDSYPQRGDIVGEFSFDEGRVPIYRESIGDFGLLVLAGDDQLVEFTEYQRESESLFVEIEKVTRSLLQELDEDQYEEMSEEEIRDKLMDVYLKVFYYAEVNASDVFGAIVKIED